MNDFINLMNDPAYKKADTEAHADAKQKVEATMAEEMQKATAGLSLPPGMKLPF